MRIIGGIVGYEDGVKTVAGDQFSPTRKVRVELNFSFDEADDASDALILDVLDKAQTFVQSKLGLEAPTASAKRAATRKPATDKTVADQHEETVTAIAKSSQVTAAIMDKDAAKAAYAAKVEGKAPAADPAAVGDEATANDPAAVGEESLDDIMGAAAPVTDKDLTDAVQKKNTEIKDPVRIRTLVFELNGGPGHEIKDIPQEKRAEFLAKLKTLTK